MGIYNALIHDFKSGGIIHMSITYNESEPMQS